MYVYVRMYNIPRLHSHTAVGNKPGIYIYIYREERKKVREREINRLYIGIYLAVDQQEIGNERERERERERA